MRSLKFTQKGYFGNGGENSPRRVLRFVNSTRSFSERDSDSYSGANIPDISNTVTSFSRFPKLGYEFCLLGILLFGSEPTSENRALLNTLFFDSPARSRLETEKDSESPGYSSCSPTRISVNEWLGGGWIGRLNCGGFATRSDEDDS